MAVPEPRGGREVAEGVGAHVGVSKESEVVGIVVTHNGQKRAAIDLVHGLASVPYLVAVKARSPTMNSFSLVVKTG